MFLRGTVEGPTMEVCPDPQHWYLGITKLSKFHDRYRKYFVNANSTLPLQCWGRGDRSCPGVWDRTRWAGAWTRCRGSWGCAHGCAPCWRAHWWSPVASAPWASGSPAARAGWRCASLALPRPPTPGRIEWFVEAPAFLRSYDSAPRLPSAPFLSRRKIVSLSPS